MRSFWVRFSLRPIWETHFSQLVLVWMFIRSTITIVLQGEFRCSSTNRDREFHSLTAFITIINSAMQHIFCSISTTKLKTNLLRKWWESCCIDSPPQVRVEFSIFTFHQLQIVKCQVFTRLPDVTSISLRGSSANNFRIKNIQFWQVTIGILELSELLFCTSKKVFFSMKNFRNKYFFMISSDGTNKSSGWW